MKANVNLEIGKEDLEYELQNLIEEIASDDISAMVRNQAEKMVEKEVKEIISPIVDNYLEKALVGREYVWHDDTKTPGRTEVDKYIKRVLQNYLDEPTFSYNRQSNKLSQRYMPSSDGGDKRTRAEHWIVDKVREYADKELFPKIEKRIDETVSSIIPDEDQIQEIIKKEIQSKFS